MILLTQVGIDGFLKIYANKDKGDTSVEGVKKTLDILGKLRAYVDEGCGPQLERRDRHGHHRQGGRAIHGRLGQG